MWVVEGGGHGVTRKPEMCCQHNVRLFESDCLTQCFTRFTCLRADVPHDSGLCYENNLTAKNVVFAGTGRHRPVIILSYIIAAYSFVTNIAIESFDRMALPTEYHIFIGFQLFMETTRHSWCKCLREIFHESIVLIG
jgi:hypothetical protein